MRKAPGVPSGPRTAVLLCGILLAGAALRFHGLDWDAGQHLHPDERFLTMVESRLGWPAGPFEIFDEFESSLNPRNRGFSYYAYGTLPAVLVKAVGAVAGREAFDELPLVGRTVSGAADLGTMLLVFLLAIRLHGDRRIALLAAGLYAVCVLPVQQAHFATVDSLATLASTAALLGIARVQSRGAPRDFVAAGALIALAAAVKLSVATLLVVGALAALSRLRRPHRRRVLGRLRAESVLFRCVLAAAAAFMVFRVAAPDAFRGPGLLGVLPSDRWISNLTETANLLRGAIDFPPSAQWAGRTRLVYPLTNLAVWGLGLPLAAAAAAGFVAAVAALLRRGERTHHVPLAWTAVLVLHQGTQWASSMRYLLPAYPALCLLAAWGLVQFVDRAPRRRLAAAVAAGVLGATALWAVAFTRVYRAPHTRLEASRWIYANVPEEARIVCEHWDDPLPLRPVEGDPYTGTYESAVLKWYDDETPAKLEEALDGLDAADILVLSSDRLSASIPRIPERWPMAVRYYTALLDGSLGFAPAAAFTSYPGIFGLSIPDAGAEEAFTVYDHPRVRIFRKTAAYTRERARRILSVDFATVVHLSARDVPRAPNALAAGRGDEGPGIAFALGAGSLALLAGCGAAALRERVR